MTDGEWAVVREAFPLPAWMNGRGGQPTAGRDGHRRERVQDRDAAQPLLERLRDRYRKITLVWIDGGYANRVVTWAAEKLQVTLQIVKRSDDRPGFVVLPRRWAGWRSRRLVRDYETLPEVHEAMVLWSMTMLGSRRRARQRA